MRSYNIYPLAGKTTYPDLIILKSKELTFGYLTGYVGIIDA